MSRPADPFISATKCSGPTVQQQASKPTAIRCDEVAQRTPKGTPAALGMITVQKRTPKPHALAVLNSFQPHRPQRPKVQAQCRPWLGLLARVHRSPHPPRPHNRFAFGWKLQRSIPMQLLQKLRAGSNLRLACRPQPTPVFTQRQRQLRARQTRTHAYNVPSVLDLRGPNSTPARTQNRPHLVSHVHAPSTCRSRNPRQLTLAHSGVRVYPSCATNRYDRERQTPELCALPHVRQRCPWP